MRKMRVALDEDTFLSLLFIKKENNEIVKYSFVPTPESILSSKYNEAQRRRISDVNSVLESKGEQLLTEEEMDFLIDPLGFNKLPEVEVSEEELQKLAGFKVEKRIISTDKHEDAE